MTVKPNDPTPDPPAPGDPPAPTPQDPPEPAATDPDRLPDDHPVVKALAKANDEAKTLRLKVKEYEDATKSDQQKLQEELEAAKADSTTTKAELARLRAAIKHKLTEDDLELLGTGTPEEIEQRAERLAARLAAAPPPKGPPASTHQGGGGAAPERDPKEVADEIERRARGL